VGIIPYINEYLKITKTDKNIKFDEKLNLRKISQKSFMVLHRNFSHRHNTYDEDTFTNNSLCNNIEI